ncbi:YlmH/Sll1252 family protein [Oscillibacter sp.]|uniref:YlmH family RNA-binding protein n=1 Tax=Oscillibacter sp. TaxID=1945593 RepID=UPI002609B37B|nr:YlmH/Sll1252 family protein [Oscillibacter sp.]MDD3347014.1 YlmH/Sll1252 family protein [Oscillibacter sp.]
MDKTKLLDRMGLAGEERMLLAGVLDRAEHARSRGIPVATDFLSPSQQMQGVDLLRLAGIAETDYVLLGGYEGAERKLFLFLPDWLEAEDAPSQSPIRLLRAAFRAEYALTHRDFLGSLMGMGIVREKVGDILVGSESADLIVLDTVAEFLLQSWSGAGRAKLTLTSLSPDEIHIPETKCEEVRDTVSSLRLDAVAATGFKTARGKAADLITGGRVQVNWRDCSKPDKLLAAGDTVSARGLGKFQLAEVGGVTKKGRTSIVVKRYL